MFLLDAITANFPAVISLVGAGGKTSTLRRLGHELAQIRRSAILTSSTRLGTDQLVNHPILFWDAKGPFRSPDEVLNVAKNLTEKVHVIFVVSKLAGNKVLGLDIATIDRLAGNFDAVVVEADGARGRSLKAPGPHEPVWPRSTQVAVAVAGIDALGKPLDERIVHRPVRVAVLSGQGIGERISLQTIVSCLAHPKGVFQGVPDGADRVVLINKVSPESLDDAKSLSRLLLSNLPSARVIIGDIQPDRVVLWS